METDVGVKLLQMKEHVGPQRPEETRKDHRLDTSEGVQSGQRLDRGLLDYRITKE